MKNGISQMIVNYAINMPKSMKWDVFANEVISEDYRENFKRSDLRLIVAPSRKKHPLGYLRLLASTIKSSKYDAIYIHCNSSMVALDLRFIRLFFHKLIFVHVHGVTTNYPKMEKALRGLMPFFISFLLMTTLLFYIHIQRKKSDTNSMEPIPNRPA